jgi:hypothetical protein
MDWKKFIKFRKLSFSDSLFLTIVLGMIFLKLASQAPKKVPMEGDFYFNDKFDSRKHYETEGAGRSIFIND